MMCSKEKIPVICPCGKTFILTPGQIRKGHGKYHNRNCYLKYGNKHLGKISASKKGVGHWNYKGNDAHYAALHLRVGAMRGKADHCEDCQKGRYFEWANITGKYEDIMDYKQLCRSCHTNYDNARKSFKVDTATAAIPGEVSLAR
jgi:hypothetical protein